MDSAHRNRSKPISEEIPAKQTEFHKYLASLSKGRAKKLCIFCAGQRGLKLFEELTGRMVCVDFFCDNDPDKYGYVTGNAVCVSLSSLIEQKNDTLVIISANKTKEIEAQLTALGFPYYTTKHSIQTMIDDTPPIGRTDCLDNVDGLDYSLPEVRALVNLFKRTVFEVCRYYEDRIKKLGSSGPK
jgi:hypothetical protein